MADKLHMDERNYKRIESGEKKTMDIDLLGRLAEVFEVDISELIKNDSVHIENNGEISNDQGSAMAYAHEINVTNNNPPDAEAKVQYGNMIQQMGEIIDANGKTIEDNNRLITLLLELQTQK